MTEVLVIDNYDSFTFNLVHYLEDLDCKVTVFRNDEFELHEASRFRKILLSPGPGIPDEAGLLKPLILNYPNKSILGICLGQQAIAEVFGGHILNLNKVHHGIASKIVLNNDEPLFAGLNHEIMVGRYHSWSVAKQLPDVLEATSIDENGEIMSLRHRTLDIKGLQFHPESVLTPDGKTILSNWLKH